LKTNAKLIYRDLRTLIFPNAFPPMHHHKQSCFEDE
jgi:hypothetical protein